MISAEYSMDPHVKKPKVDTDIVMEKENMKKAGLQLNPKLSRKKVLTTSELNPGIVVADNRQMPTKISEGGGGSKSVVADAQELDEVSSSKSKVKSKKCKTNGKSSSARDTKTETESTKRKRCMPKTVNKHLEKMNIQPDKVSCCLKSAMSKGYLRITGDPSDLEQVIIEDEYEEHKFKVHVKDILYQYDCGGMDCLTVDAPAICVCCDPDDEDFDGVAHAYVTRMCVGQPSLTSGKYHNHCTECKGFGQCRGDYRSAHCSKCNKHYYAGYRASCYNCKSENESDDETGKREDWLFPYY